MKTKDELTDEMLNILERFDFEKVHAYMTLKDWKVKDGIVDIKAIRQKALEMMENAIESYVKKSDMVMVMNEAFGLLTRINDDGHIRLLFFIEMKQSYLI